MNRTSTYRNIILALLAAVSFSLLNSCKQEIPTEVFFEEDELSISAYLDEHADEFSTLTRVLDITDLKNTLNAYGHYTLFAPHNEAFSNFCDQAGKSSVDEFEREYLTNLVQYHLIDIELESAYFRDGAIPDTTYSGDYLVISFSEGGLETVHVNDALVTERDILVENGVIHKIDKVFPPIIGSVVERLQETGEYDIFSQALELCGLADTLNIIRIDLNEDMFIRSRFTLFAEPDAVFQQAGINSAEELVAEYSDTGDPYSKEDGFYRFMAYHIVPGLYYLNEIDSFNYPTLAENMLINVTLQDEIFLNRHEEDAGGKLVEKYITVVEEGSNQQAKNGVFHRIDTIMEPYLPSPTYIIVDLTDYQGLSLGQKYDEKELEDIWGISADNTGIYYRNSILNDGETNLQTTSNKVGWEVEFEIPTILQGHYEMTLYWVSYQGNSSSVQVFWDDSPLGDPIWMVHSKRWPGVEWKYDYNTSQWLGRLLLTETGPHTLKFVALEAGYGNFDYMALRPVEE